MNIGIIDIGIGNLRSIQNILDRLGYPSSIIREKEGLGAADKLLLPGMGNFDKCMQALNESGLREELEIQVLQNRKPFMGICVGLQMLMRRSDEGAEKGLAWIDGDTVGFNISRLASNQKVPNMGWLDILVQHPNDLSGDLSEARFYFAHSFHVQVDRDEDIWITAEYGYPFTAAIKRNNIYGVQFHPEKSHKYGMQLFKNFAERA